LTNPDNSRHLTPAQELAAALIAQGYSDGEAAKIAKVSRQTLNGWKNHNEGFREAVEKAQAELWEDTRPRIRALCGKALDTLTRRLNEDDLAAALGLLKVAAAFEKIPGPPPGKTIVEVRYVDEGKPDFTKMSDNELKAIAEGKAY